MKKSCFAMLLGLLLIASFSCSNDDDDTSGVTECIDPSKIDDHAVCQAILKPVCGCDGITYGNACEAEVRGVLKWTDGACQ